MTSASFLNLIWFSKKNNVPKSKESLNQFKIQFQNYSFMSLKISGSVNFNTSSRRKEFFKLLSILSTFLNIDNILKIRL